MNFVQSNIKETNVLITIRVIITWLSCSHINFFQNPVMVMLIQCSFLESNANSMHYFQKLFTPCLVYMHLLENQKCNYLNNIWMYSKTCVKRLLKIDKTNILMTNGSFMKVESIAECPPAPPPPPPPPKVLLYIAIFYLPFFPLTLSHL